MSRAAASAAVFDASLMSVRPAAVRTTRLERASARVAFAPYDAALFERKQRAGHSRRGQLQVAGQVGRPPARFGRFRQRTQQAQLGETEPVMAAQSRLELTGNRGMRFRKAQQGCQVSVVHRGA